MSLLAPMICGQWDACHLWAQWNPVPEARYFLEWRWRTKVEDAWSEWQRVGGELGLERPWMSIALHRAEHLVQARVAIAPPALPRPQPEPEWELAQEVTFSKSTCRFVVRSLFRSVQVDKGTIVDCIVDNAPASYRLLPAAPVIIVAAGGEAEMDAEALHPTGWMQLDRPGHFSCSPQLGVTIENVQPSENDVAPTGRDYTTMQAIRLADDEMVPLRLAVKRQNIR